MDLREIRKWKNKLICLYIDIFSNTLRIMISRPESDRSNVVTLQPFVSFSG